jgi:hypothetical protein
MVGRERRESEEDGGNERVTSPVFEIYQHYDHYTPRMSSPSAGLRSSGWGYRI